MPAITFQQASELIEHCIQVEEGGWKLTNNPDDPGGWTYGGMTWGTYASWMARQDPSTPITLNNFTEMARRHSDVLQSEIRECYFELFLDPFKFDSKMLDGFIRERGVQMIYSSAVNSGLERAILLCQSTHNTIMRADQAITYDGKIGPQTRAAIDRMLVFYAQLFIKEYMLRWLQFYASIVKRNSLQLKNGQTRIVLANNLGGWINRVWRFMP